MTIIDTPYVDWPIFTTWNNIFSVRSKGTLYYWWLVQEISQNIFLFSFISVQKYNHVISCSNQYKISTITKFHYLYLTIFIKFPVTEWPSLALLCTKKAYSCIGFLRWHFTPSSCKNKTTWVITCNRISPTVLLLNI